MSLKSRDGRKRWVLFAFGVCAELRKTADVGGKSFRDMSDEINRRRVVRRGAEVPNGEAISGRDVSSSGSGLADAFGPIIVISDTSAGATVGCSVGSSASFS